MSESNPWKELFIERENLECKLVRLYSKSKAWQLYEKLNKEITFLTDVKVFVAGKFFPIRRKIAAQGDPGTTYAFSWTNIVGQPWTDTISYIKRDAEKFAGTKFNYVLINKYSDGKDFISAHQDRDCDDKIATVSFGATRKIIFSRKGYKSETLTLAHGSIMLMQGDTNRLWFHRIPKTRKCFTPRISLTFRKLNA